jgi:hypothetical protein
VNQDASNFSSKYCLKESAVEKLEEATWVAFGVAPANLTGERMRRQCKEGVETNVRQRLLQPARLLGSMRADLALVVQVLLQLCHHGVALAAQSLKLQAQRLLRRLQLLNLRTRITAMSPKFMIHAYKEYR